MPIPKLLILLIVSCLLSCNDDDKTKRITEESQSNTKCPVAFDTVSAQLKTTQGYHQAQPARLVNIAYLKASHPDTCVPPNTNTSFQVFTFSNNRDTTLICKEGTLVKISKGSFESADSKKEVTLKIKEYYSIADMLAANLSTTSNGEILETGGMLFIQAHTDGKPCTLKDGKKLEVAFPFSKRKDGMIAFAGAYINGKMNWTRMFPDTVPVVEQPAAYPGGITALRRFLGKNLEFPDSLADINISGTVLLDFVIDETGRPVDVNIKNKAHQAFREAVLKTYAKMPAWKPAMKDGKAVKSSFSQTITFFNTEGDMFDTSYKKEFERRVNDTTINNLNVEEIRYYVLSVSRLGWINCDRFLNDPRSKTDFLVDIGNYSDIDVKIVLHSYKSILQGYDTTTGTIFKGVPLAEKITIVAVKKTSNTNYLAMVESHTSDKVIKYLPFEEVSMQQLRQKLEQLNRLE